MRRPVSCQYLPWTRVNCCGFLSQLQQQNLTNIFCIISLIRHEGGGLEGGGENYLGVVGVGQPLSSVELVVT